MPELWEETAAMLKKACCPREREMCPGSVDPYKSLLRKPAALAVLESPEKKS